MTDMPSESLQKHYRRAFVRNCLALMVRAHAQLDTGSLQAAQEPHITGELVRSARNLVEDTTAEQWMEHLEIHDDPPQDRPATYGKKRPRIDIEFVQTGRGKRPRFKIEAKRLHRSDSISAYIGDDGIQMFVKGTYAADWPSAGMIGYFQTGDHATWLTSLAKGFSEHRKELKICRELSPWDAAGFAGDNLESVQASCHERTPDSLGRIEIYHLLLEFVDLGEAVISHEGTAAN